MVMTKMLMNYENYVLLNKCIIKCKLYELSLKISKFVPLIQRSFIIYIKFCPFPEPPHISLYESRVLVASGEAATLFCGADGIPRPAIHWYKGDVEVSVDRQRDI